MPSVAYQVLRLAEDRRALGCVLEFRPLVQAADDHGYRMEPPQPRRGGDGPPYVTLHLPGWQSAVFYLMADRMNFRVGKGRTAIAERLIRLGGEDVDYGNASSHPPEVRFWHLTAEGVTRCGRALAAAAAARPPG